MSLLLLALLGLSACHHEAGPLPPLAAEQIAAEFGKAFGTAKQDVKAAADKVLKALDAKDYPAAYQAVQELCGLGDATKEQQTLSARAMLTIAGLLQTAQSQGDEKAGAALKLYQSTK